MFLSLSQLCAAQDVITLKTGEQLKSKIIEVGQTEIRYKKYDNQTGPVYVLAKSEVSEIVYENGSRDEFVKKDSELTKEVARTPGTPAEAEKKQASKVSRFLLGFSGVYPTGTWPATALSNMGSTSFLKSQGHTVKSYGFGVLIQGRVTDNFSLFFDMNAYEYNILAGKKGTDVQTVWTVAESATHWDESGAPQIQYVHNLPTDVHFDMQSTGMRLGAKYIVGKNKIRPWLGAAFGYYTWTVNYYNEDKTKTYGKDNGSATGFTFMLGVDFEVMPGVVLTPFVDMGAPVANYKIEGLFYPQWDIDYNAHIMGTNRFGLTLAFSPVKKQKN